MKIKDLTVINSSARFENLEITLEGPGVYRINGANGVGKTTILEKSYSDKITPNSAIRNMQNIIKMKDRDYLLMCHRIFRYTRKKRAFT